MQYRPCTEPLNWKREPKVQGSRGGLSMRKPQDESPGPSSFLEGDYLNDLGDLLLYYPFHPVL